MDSLPVGNKLLCGVLYICRTRESAFENVLEELLYCQMLCLKKM